MLMYLRPPAADLEGRVRQRRPVSPADEFDERAVGPLADHLHDLVPQADVHGLGPDERLVGVGAPPVEVRPAVTPVAPLPLPQRRGDMAVAVGLVDPAQRELPAHLGLPVERAFAARHRGLVQGAARPGVEARPVEEDAGSVDESGDGLALGVHLDGAPAPVGLLLELPLVSAEALRQPLDPALVGLVGEVRAVRAATLLELRRRPGEHALAPSTEDAGPWARQERHVEHPGAFLVGILERDPLVQVRGLGRLHRGERSSGQDGPMRNSGEPAGAALAALVADLQSALGAGRVRAEPHELGLYAHDASIVEGGDAPVVCFPTSTAEVQACVRIARAHGRPFTPRGAGTGLAGGAVPLGGPVVIVTTKMNRICSIDPGERVAWVEPGVVNLDLTRALAPYGLHFAPDPSSQQACSIGGNVANNSGGPHCLAYGVTSAHVLALEVVLPDGSVAVLGGLDAEPPGYDLRGVFVGSEGTCGIATRIAVRLTPDPPAVRTLLVDFLSMDDAAECVSAIIAAGLVPAALEMMAGAMMDAVEAFVHAGYPTDAEAVLLVEIDGLPAFVDDAVDQVRRIASDHGARSVRVAADEAERQ